MIKVEVRDLSEDFKKKLRFLQASDKADRPIEIAAWRCQADLVGLTPKRWTGQARKHWQVKKTGPALWTVFNPSPVMGYLERGTGEKTGGWIYPKKGKRLYIPKTQRAMYGWQKGFVYGEDYLALPRVRGIKARWIARDYAPKANLILKTEMIKFIRNELAKP